jgi:RND superfamily putative drug exporter
LLIGGVSVLATFLAVGGLTELTGVSQIVEFLIALIGLGVAIDYSLLVVSRWREERAAGARNAAAVTAAMNHAGRAVVFSGLTVAIGLVSMIVLPVPMLRSVGYGGVLVPLVSVLVAVTLLPVILVTVIPRAETGLPAGQATISVMERHLLASPHVIGVGGDGASLIDFNHAVYGNFPLMLALIGIATFLLLTRAFRSVLLAAKAVAFNLISLAAAYGVLTWVWQDGHGSQAIWGIPATGAITMWVPLMVFAFLFGLSMDYEVFILTRIREEYDTGGDARRAVTEGLGRTGRLVTGAAAILMFSFLSMSTGPQTDLKILATGLGAGILVDAVVVRCLLVPAMVSLFGRANWWLPAPMARLLRVGTASLPCAGTGPRLQAGSSASHPACAPAGLTPLEVPLAGPTHAGPASPAGPISAGGPASAGELGPPAR